MKLWLPGSSCSRHLIKSMQGLGRDRDTTFFTVMLESSFVHKSIAAPHFGADYDTVVVPMVPSISVIFLLWQCIVQVSYKGSQRALSLSLSLSLLLKKSGVMCGHWHGWRSLEFQLLPIPSTLPNPPSNHLQLPWTPQGYQKDRPQTLQTAKSFCLADSTHTQK